MFNKEGTATHIDGILYFVRFCLATLIEYKREDIGNTIDYDAWDEAYEFLELIELSYMKAISKTEMLKNTADKLDTGIDHSLGSYIS